ncbi:MAG TPA: SdrD B-like domain-containing protein [Anaerolineae bacterium]|nr:SdrD B-like domain-containing protein [Anaerolineae bacterium]
MSSPSDQQLIQFIGQGRREALGELFDRYSADLYDYLARLVGDRDQAARLLETVYLRVPGAAPGFQPRDSVRGWLYSLAREAGLDWLRQRGWLDGLPPSDEPIAPGLQGDVWKAARAMPAFFRAVLITEELQPLSPTEKARALGVNRTDLPRLIDEARRSFNRIYDAQARAEGRPTSDRIDPDTVWNARRRVPVEGGSLFGFLPPIPLPDSLEQQIRRRVLEAMAPPAQAVVAEPAQEPSAANLAGAAAAAAALNAAQTVPQQTVPPPIILQPTEPPPRRTAPPPPPQPQPGPFGGGGMGAIALPALIGVALALLLCAGIYILTQNRSKPLITSVQPANGSTIQQTPEINVFAVYADDHDIDRNGSTMQIDGRAVVPTWVNNTIAWSGPLDPGSHNAAVLLKDTSGNTTSQSWAFFVIAASTPIPPPSGVPSITPVATVTPIIPVTAEVATVTPVVVTATPSCPPFCPPPPCPPNCPPPPPPCQPWPQCSFPTPPPCQPWPQCSFPPTQPPPPPCNRGGIAGVTFNDLNGNGVRDPNEPGLAGVVVNLTTLSNSVLAVAVSDTFGNYRFSDVPFGQYRVQANTPTGWFPTTPTTIAVNLFGCGTVSGFNFGFVQAPPPVTATWTPVTPIIITATPTYTPIAPPFSVTNVSAFVSPTSSTTCPQTFTFNGAITTNGAGNVTYQWQRSDGSLTPTQVLTFLGAGTQNVAPDSWTLGVPGFNFNGWDRIQVLTPNNITSAQATFTLNCPPGPTNTPTSPPPPTDTPTTVPPPFAVTASTAKVSPTSSVTCPQNFTFTGDITVTGTGNVTYQWVHDGSSEAPQVLTFLVPGTQNVAPFVLNVPGASPFVGSGSGHIHVLTPNVFDSPDANWTLNCP